MSTYKGTIRINGRKHEVEVRNGVRYIDGMTVEAFVDTLDKMTQIELAEVGQQAIIDEKKGTKNSRYQKMMDRNHIIKSN